jgi:hypothetical protein
MSVFTNPASRSVEQAKAYTAAVLELLGTRDPMEVLRTTVSALQEHANGLSHEELIRPESHGKWSIVQVLQHLADSELIWGYRLRMILTHDRPKLTGYNQDLWATRLRYNESTVEETLDIFRVLRQSNMRLLTQAAEEDLKRVGIHEERGEESLELMVRLYAGHDVLHLRQIERIKRAVISG